MTDALAREPTAYAGAGSGLRRRVEFGDALMLLYLLAFARQYLWVVEPGAAAWGLSAVLAGLACYAYMVTKPFPSEKFGVQFWLVVGLPLLAVYLLRAAFPDVSFDVLNYRLLHAERSLGGTLYAPGDFFPTYAPFNPAPDTMTGLARRLLGYRLGTLFNLLVLVWAAQVADKILRPFVARAWPRALCVLLVVLAEHVLFEVNNYMTDLLALPLLLEATYLILRMDEAEGGRRRGLLVQVAFLLGAAVAIKLTNAVVALPLVFVCAGRALWGRGRLALRDWPAASALALAAFVAPGLPFSVYLYRLTGSAVFPVFNSFFKSPFWPEHGGWDTRWGPVGAWEKIAWPVLIFFEPGRHSELAVYSGRISLGFLSAACGLLLVRREARLRMLCLLCLSCSLLWSIAGLGYSRYGLFLELLSGVVVIAFASVLARGAERPRALSRLPALSWRTAVAALVSAALVAQTALAVSYVGTHEWSMRPTVFNNPRAYLTESKQFLRDRSLASYLTPEQATLFGGVGVWVESCMKTSGIEVLLNGRAPVIGVRHEEYFSTRAGREKYVESVRALADRRMFSLCFPEEAQAARALLERRGLQAGSARAVTVPFFSETAPTTLALLEVSPRPGSLELSADFWSGTPFPGADYRAKIEAASPPSKLKAGAKAPLVFKVKNLGGAVWPSRAGRDGRFQVNLGNRWLDAGSGEVVNNMDSRTALASDLAPGAEAELPLTVTAPAKPGDYVLELDMVHEGVTWFHEKGSETLKLRVRVEP
jgi:hypothetical protein